LHHLLLQALYHLLEPQRFLVEVDLLLVHLSILLIVARLQAVVRPQEEDHQDHLLRVRYLPLEMVHHLEEALHR
jgi:hypothetical protein